MTDRPSGGGAASSARRTASPSAVGSKRTVSRPCWICDRSRRFSISPRIRSAWRPSPSITCFKTSSPSSSPREAARSAKPSRLVSGVRSSCAALAMNSLFNTSTRRISAAIRSRSTTRPSCVPMFAITSSSVGSGTSATGEKNSRTATTSLPTNTGNAKPATTPRSTAVRARGKFGSLMTSVTHAGFPFAATRPGRPAPISSGMASVTRLNCSYRSVSSTCHSVEGVRCVPSFSSV